MKKQNSLEFSKKGMRAYGKYSLEQRAIPAQPDGLKPVHRRVLWSAYKLGILSHKPTTKCARIVGDTIAKYHPHGDAGVYGGLVTMVASFTEPLFEAQGNFGNKITGDGAAHYRYTETRLTKFAENYLLDPKYLAVTPMIPNYDGKELEPVYLPAKLPLCLIHNIEGIATGASVVIPSFTVESLTKVVILALRRGNINSKLCAKYLEFAFREGGFVEADEETDKFFKTGQGSITVYPEMEFNAKQNSAIMTSYTPRFKIEHLQKALNLKGVLDVEDLTSSKNGVKIIFKLSRGLSASEAQDLTSKLQDLFASKLPANLLITKRQDNGEDIDLMYTTPHQIINDWLEWRIDFEKKVVLRLISIEEAKVQKLEWLLWAMKNKKLISDCTEYDNPEKTLAKKGKITIEHATFIYDQQYRRLFKLEEKKLVAEAKERKTTVKTLKADIKNKETISNRISLQLKDKKGK